MKLHTGKCKNASRKLWLNTSSKFLFNILKNLEIVGLGFLILYWITFPLVQSWSLIYSDVNLSNGLNLIIYYIKIFISLEKYWGNPVLQLLILSYSSLSV